MKQPYWLLIDLEGYTMENPVYAWQMLGNISVAEIGIALILLMAGILIGFVLRSTDEASKQWLLTVLAGFGFVQIGLAAITWWSGYHFTVWGVMTIVAIAAFVAGIGFKDYRMKKLREDVLARLDDKK